MGDECKIKTPSWGVLLLVAAGIVLGHLGGALHVPIQGSAHSGQADYHGITMLNIISVRDIFHFGNRGLVKKIKILLIGGFFVPPSELEPLIGL